MYFHGFTQIKFILLEMEKTNFLSYSDIVNNTSSNCTCEIAKGKKRLKNFNFFS